MAILISDIFQCYNTVILIKLFTISFAQSFQCIRRLVASDNIRSAMGCLLVTPGETRWNSTYDAVVKIHHLLSSPNTEAKFDKLCEELDIRRLLPQQKTFVQEYVEVFQPVCCGLDVLQEEKDVGLAMVISFQRWQL